MIIEALLLDGRVILEGEPSAAGLPLNELCTLVVTVDDARVAYARVVCSDPMWIAVSALLSSWSLDLRRAPNGDGPASFELMRLSLMHTADASLAVWVVPADAVMSVRASPGVIVPRSGPRTQVAIRRGIVGSDRFCRVELDVDIFGLPRESRVYDCPEAEIDRARDLAIQALGGRYAWHVDGFPTAYTETETVEIDSRAPIPTTEAVRLRTDFPAEAP